MYYIDNHTEFFPPLQIARTPCKKRVIYTFVEERQFLSCLIDPKNIKVLTENANRILYMTFFFFNSILPCTLKNYRVLLQNEQGENDAPNKDKNNKGDECAFILFFFLSLPRIGLSS